MKRLAKLVAAAAVCSAAGLAMRSLVLANGGPFVIKYPQGDPAAKGVLARLSPDLRPGRERRLRVVTEDLKIIFERDGNLGYPGTKPEPLPLVRVAAAYTIENPTGEEIAVDFGFPILRGIYIVPRGMTSRPDVRVDVDGKHQAATIISNSVIYGIIRKRAREAIELGIESDAELGRLVTQVRSLPAGSRRAAREALAAYLAGSLRWRERDSGLMVEYASLDFGKPKGYPRDRVRVWWLGKETDELVKANLGPLCAIGEQKATQFFAQLASRFDPGAVASYEAIFTAWGGDMRERSVDLRTGRVRPREVTVDPKILKDPNRRWLSAHRGDPTIYARVDYFDESAKISEEEKTSCRAVLKNLPVVFTFAPMNLLHYQVKFPASSRQVLTVTYRQYAYVDTRDPKSYQLAYVVHPASLWDKFGPINLEVSVPEGVGLRASVPCKSEGLRQRAQQSRQSVQTKAPKARFSVYRSRLTKKTGELLVGIDAESWRKATVRLAASKPRAR